MPDEHESGSLKNLLSFRGLIEDAPLLAEAIVDTVQNSVLLLDTELKVILANRSFYVTFKVEPAETLEGMVYELGDGQWNIPELRTLLEDVLPNNQSFSGYEVTHTFPDIGRKVMRLNARKLRRRDDQPNLVLLAIEDITELYDQQQQLRQLVRDKEVLVQEVHHRVKNNLQTIASLLSLHSGYTDNPDVTAALAEAGGRVQVIAQLHEKLYASANLEEVDVGEYLRKLTTTLQKLHGRPEVTFNVDTDDIVLNMEQAAPLGLIANELILNCFKHAFPAGRAGHVAVSLQYVRNSVPNGESLDDGVARLEVQDDGIGLPAGVDTEKTTSMGLALVRLLSRQLRAERVCVTAKGVRWTVTFPMTASKQQEESLGESADSGR
jgi:chemotaxis protein methyltransferase CheR